MGFYYICGWIDQKVVNHWEQKGGRLSGSRLCAGHQVSQGNKLTFRMKIFSKTLTNSQISGSFLDFSSEFQKMVAVRSSVCRAILIRSALESPDAGASDGGPNFSFRHFGAGRDSRFWAIPRLQKPPCLPQSVGN